MGADCYCRDRWRYQDAANDGRAGTARTASGCNGATITEATGETRQMASRIKRRLLYWLLWIAAGAIVTLASNAYAAEDVIKPPPGTIPEAPEPWRGLTYCPIMFRSDAEVWIWPASR